MQLLHACVFQGDANKSEADDDRLSLGYQDEEKLKELYAAGAIFDLKILPYPFKNTILYHI